MCQGYDFYVLGQKIIKIFFGRKQELESSMICLQLEDGRIEKVSLKGKYYVI